MLVHRGTAAFGHYYAYIKDFATGQWMEFNDGAALPAFLSVFPCVVRVFCSVCFW